MFSVKKKITSEQAHFKGNYKLCYSQGKIHQSGETHSGLGWTSRRQHEVFKCLKASGYSCQIGDDIEL